MVSSNTDTIVSVMLCCVVLYGVVAGGLTDNSQVPRVECTLKHRWSKIIRQSDSGGIHASVPTVKVIKNH